MPEAGQGRLRRGLVVLAAILFAWALFVMMTGGVGFRYGPIYRWRNIWPNLTLYPRWLVESQTPLVLVAFAAPFVLRPRAPGDADRVRVRCARLLRGLHAI